MGIEQNDRAHAQPEVRTAQLSTLDVIPPPGATTTPGDGGKGRAGAGAMAAAGGTAADAVASGKTGAAGVPCESPIPQFRGLSNDALQSEINATMAEGGYIFKNPEKGAAAIALAEKRHADQGDTSWKYSEKKDFNDDLNLTPIQKEFIGAAQSAKGFNNYKGAEACTTITDPNYRQRGAHELLPQSMDKDLTADDIKQLGKDGTVSMDQLRLARNEIFMRGGRPFMSTELANYAIEQGFKPRLNYNEMTDFSAREGRNAALLQSIETCMRGQKTQQVDSATLDKWVADFNTKHPLQSNG
jgi:hypothetical protein